MTNKEALRDLVADLQLARMRFNETVEIYPERPIDHFIINFSEAVDSAVDAVFGIYNDVMLQEIDGDICGKGVKDEFKKGNTLGAYLEDQHERT